MAENWFAATKGITCANEIARMKRFVRSQKIHWRTQYMPSLHPEHPVRKKVGSIRRYHLFMVKFYGGTAEILARNFSVSPSDN